MASTKKIDVKSDVLEKAQLLSVLNDITRKCFWLVVKEAVCAQCRNQIHYKIVDGPVTGMHDLCSIFQQVIDGFYDLSFA